MLKIKNFLAKGNYLKFTDQVESELSLNGIKLKDNIGAALCKSYRIPQEGHVLKSTSSSSEILESELENGLILKQVYDQWISKKDSRDLSFLQKPLINDVWTSYTLLPNWSKTANFAYQDFLRTRRRFWRSLLFDPGPLLKVTESDTRGQCPSALIEANFENEMGSLNLEKINVLKQDISDDVKLVQTESNLYNATLTVLMTSVRKRIFLDSTRLALPKHLSPYHVTVFSPQAANKNLSQFIHYLKLLLKSEGLLVLDSSNTKTLEELYEEADFLGTPYVVVVPEQSLSNGVLLVRDRETCIFEQVHCALLTQKLAKIFLNKEVKSTWDSIADRKDLITTTNLNPKAKPKQTLQKSCRELPLK